MITSFFQSLAIFKKSKTLKIVSSLLVFILIIASFPVPAHATAVPINVELNQFTSANVAGDGGTSLLWKKANANTTDSGVLRIVPNIGNQHGVVVRRNKIKLTGGFSTNFVMNMNGSKSSLPADGLTFVIQSNSEPEVGNWGAGLGYQSVGKSLGVEFDIWKNTGWDVATSTGQYYYDPNASHVAIVKNGDNMHTPANMDAIDDGTLTTGTVVTNGAGTRLTSDNSGTPLSLYREDGTLDVNVWIDYDGTTLTATYGPSSIKTSGSNRVISKNVGNDLNNQDVYVGFSGSTGGSNANIDIKKWSFTDTYDPDPVLPPIQGANSVGITLIPGSINPTTANFLVKDINNNNMLNQDVAVYLDDSTTPISTINTGTNGAQATYSIGTLSAGSHTIKGVAANGGASNFTSFSVIIPITAIGAISGSPQVGTVLTAGALTPVGATATYQWQIAPTVNGSYSNINGATGTTYIPVAGDLAKFIKVVATGIGNYSGTVTSTPTQAVATPPSLYISPVDATIPLGSTQQFQALFTANGTTALAQDAFDYALFSGSQTSNLSISGNNHTVIGNAHSNKEVRLSGTENIITGTCEAVSTVEISGNNNTVGSAAQNAAIIGMPDFSSAIQAMAEAAGQIYNGNITYSGNDKVSVTSPIYVDGSVSISGSTFSGMGTIVATGDINISGNSSYSNGNDSVCLYSKNGDIKISGNSQTVNGMLYAPNGTISISGQNQIINGRVIGKVIDLKGGNTQIKSSSNDLNSLPQINWSSSNPDVASISLDGVATGNGLGTCTITTTYLLNNTTYQASAQLTVVSLTAISPTMATFDKNSDNTSVGHYADVATTMTLYGATLSSIKNGSVILTSDSDYTISGSTVTIKKAYLAKQSIGTTSLTFSFSDGSTKTLTVTVSDSTPPTISPTTAKFDKNTANINPGHYADVATTMTLNAATLSSIMNGSAALTAGIDYTISGSSVTIKKEYLAKQSIGTTSLTFTFSDGSTQTLTVTVIDSTSPTINPTVATFDKNSASTNYTDVATTMTLNTATLSSIMNGSAALTAGSDYTISGSSVTILKEYLITQSIGTTSLTFTFSDGSTQTLTVTVSDSTSPTISPTVATFDKNSASTKYMDVETTMTLNTATLSSIMNGSAALTAGIDYTISGSSVTIKKEYLATQSIGTATLAFTFSDGSTQNFSVTVIDSRSPTISPATATFDKNTTNTSVGHYADVETTMTLYSTTLMSIKRGKKVLSANTNYTVSGSTVTIKKEYLATRSVGNTNLKFTFSDGSTKILVVTVSNSISPTINPTTATFDKNSANINPGHYADVATTMTLNTASLSSIENGSVTLTEGSDYTKSGSTVSIPKAYLAAQSLGTTSLTFTFSDGSTKLLTVTVSDSTPTIDPTTATFDKNSANTSAGNYADIPVTMTLNGNSLTAITNGGTTLNAGSDYTVSGSNVTLSTMYLLTLPTSEIPTNLTFTFSSGNTQVLGITVSDSVPTIDPTTATFDKNTSNTSTGHYADIPVTMTLNGSNFISIANGSTLLTEGSHYTKSEVTNGTQTVTLSKTYLLTLPTSSTATSLTFQFNGENGANTQTLNITVSNSKLISDLSIATQTGAHRISILPNVPIQANIGLKLSRPATYLTMDFSKSNLNVGLPNRYCENLDSGQKIRFSIDRTNPKKIILHPTDPNTTFPGGTYTFGAYITEDSTSLVMEATAIAQDAVDLTFIDSTDANSAMSLEITVGTAPPLH